jgi:hypothetical protein
MLNFLEALENLFPGEEEAIGRCEKWEYAMLLLLVVNDLKFCLVVFAKSLTPYSRVSGRYSSSGSQVLSCLVFGEKVVSNGMC